MNPTDIPIPIDEKAPVSRHEPVVPEALPIEGNGQSERTDPEVAAPRSVSRTGRRQILLPLDAIDVPPEQARTLPRDEATLEQLARSVRAHGVLQPVLVRPKPSGRFELVLGFGRYSVAGPAGLTHIPAQIIEEDLGPAEIARLQFIENQLREGLNPIDLGGLFQRVGRETGLKQQKLADYLDISQSYLSDVLQALRAPADIREGLASGKLSLKKALQLLRARKKERGAEGSAVGSAPKEEPPRAKGGSKTGAAHSGIVWKDTEAGLTFTVGGKRKTPPPLETVLQSAERWLQVLRRMAESQGGGA